METFFLILLFIPYVVMRYHLTDHDTPSEKDKKRLVEGIELFQNQEYSKAFEYFNQALKLNRKSAVAYAYRGKCNMKEENLFSALYDFTQAISFDNTLPDVHLDRGIVQYKLGEFENAFLSFDKAVWFSRGEEPESLRWRALARLKLHQHSQAEKDLQKAVKLGDEDAAFVLSRPPFFRNINV
jgi:tetratricopeptide (TPR) repeat protein